MTDASEALLGLSTGLLGVGILHACWRRWLAPRWLAVPAGGALVLLSPRFWVRFGGVELGTAYAALSTALLAWLFVAMSVQVRDPKERRELPRRTAPKLSSPALARALSRFAVVVPLAGTASLLASIAFSTILPWAEADRNALAIFLTPALWGVSAVWAAADQKLRRPAIALGGCALLGAARVYF
jgi:hypothetical protein